LTIKDVDGKVVDSFTLNLDMAKNQIKQIFVDAMNRIQRPFDLDQESACLVFSKKENQRPQPVFLRKSEVLRIAEAINV